MIKLLDQPKCAPSFDGERKPLAPLAALACSDGTIALVYEGGEVAKVSAQEFAELTSA